MTANTAIFYGIANVDANVDATLFVVKHGRIVVNAGEPLEPRDVSQQATRTKASGSGEMIKNKKSQQQQQ